jgi:hypothetical protein
MLVLLVALLVTVATAAGALSAGSGARSAPARLRLVDTDPVTLRATGFKAHEHARLSISADKVSVRRSATAGSGGGFTMRLPGVDANACTGFSVTAIGDRGSRATYKRAPGMCPVP